MDKLIRGIPDDAAAILKEQAKASGLTLEAYLRLKLIELAKEIRMAEEVTEFQVGQFIENNGKTGKILEVYFSAYSVRVGEYERATWTKSVALTLSSEAAYNAQLAGDEAALQAARAALTAKSRQPKTTLRWVCLECSTKYNGVRCPTCGSNERLHNTDADTDPSILAEVGKGEPYTPKDE